VKTKADDEDEETKTRLPILSSIGMNERRMCEEKREKRIPTASRYSQE